VKRLKKLGLKAKIEICQDKQSKAHAEKSQRAKIDRPYSADGFNREAHPPSLARYAI
jgi:hypothetical protein